jgi:glutathione S-transferase
MSGAAPKAILHVWEGSPSQRVVWLMGEAGIPDDAIELKNVDVALKEHSQPKFRTLNPLGLLPFYLEGEFNLYESVAIGDYILARFNKLPQFQPLTNELKPRALHESIVCFCISEIDHRVLPAASLLLVNKSFDKSRMGAISHHYELFRSLAVPFISSILEQGNGEFLIGNRITVADIVVTFTLTVAHRLGWLHDCKKIEGYLNKMWAREACKKALSFWLNMTPMDHSYLKDVPVMGEYMYVGSRPAEIGALPGSRPADIDSRSAEIIVKPTSKNLEGLPKSPDTLANSGVLPISSSYPAGTTSTTRTVIPSTAGTSSLSQDSNWSALDSAPLAASSIDSSSKSADRDSSRYKWQVDPSPNWSASAAPISSAKPSMDAGTAGKTTTGAGETPFYGDSLSAGQEAVYGQGRPLAASTTSSGLGQPIQPNPPLPGTTMGGEFGHDIQSSSTSSYDSNPVPPAPVTSMAGEFGHDVPVNDSTQDQRKSSRFGKMFDKFTHGESSSAAATTSDTGSTLSSTETTVTKAPQIGTEGLQSGTTGTGETQKKHMLF